MSKRSSGRQPNHPSPLVFLTKSDFKVAQTCATKLYYRKRKYPTTLEDDEYLAFLADGGFMVEALAHLHFPQGMEMPFHAGVENAARHSAAAFTSEQTTLFEPTFIADKLMARVDILERKGRDVRIIEVKAKSIDTSRDLSDVFMSRNGIRASWRPCLEDVAFQTLVLRRLYPELSFTSFLCLPDKSKTTSIDLLHKHFAFTDAPKDVEAKMRRPTVTFIGDAEAAVRDSFLAFVDVSEWVELLLPELEQEANHFANDLKCGEIKAPPVIGTKCAKCEFRVGDKSPNGFAECWGALATTSPHVLDYYHVGNLGGRGAPVVQGLLAKGKAGLFDVPEESITDAKGQVGPVAQRQLLQREYTLRNEEFCSSEMSNLLAAHEYPLHFIDFEASRIAIPYHAGMRPYEQACFQWSCHTIREPGGLVEHAEWINVEDTYPNIEFARTLAEKVPAKGTVYIWSKFEIYALKDILQQMEYYRQGEDELRFWLDAMINARDFSGLEVIDLCDMAKQHYFHPAMKGRLSIKYVLPAVWGSNPTLWSQPAFSPYYREGRDGKSVSPYDTLPDLAFGDGGIDDEGVDAVREGTGAVRAYQELLYGPSSLVPDRKEAWRMALLQYCKLDTAAMVMIWEHWRGESR